MSMEAEVWSRLDGLMEFPLVSKDSVSDIHLVLSMQIVLSESLIILSEISWSSFPSLMGGLMTGQSQVGLVIFRPEPRCISF